MCKHYGFLIDGRFVVHNTPSKTNEYGGNIIIDSYTNFLQDRKKVYSLQNTDLTPKEVYDYYNKNKARKFNYLTFNCEQFVKDVMTGNRGLSILARVLLVGSIAYLYLK